MSPARSSRIARAAGATDTAAITPFLLRLPSAVHRSLTARAAARKLSLNEYCVRKLAGPESIALVDSTAVEIAARADAVAGARLLGIIVHGSWARGEARTTSDVDVLLVVDRAVA